MAASIAAHCAAVWHVELGMIDPVDVSRRQTFFSLMGLVNSGCDEVPPPCALAAAERDKATASKTTFILISFGDGWVIQLVSQSEFHRGF
ncbi:hypothetical protein [Sphingomonas sp. PAMC 26617]|uniref:hypothetical protein n=1 Tax=Sphingomonas sp. PAMC 26617 TaxID=1112216 RepID=UPI0002890F72|nr:hypothetical protein [Sphingomonas sp. PAMC 26617]